MWVGIFPEGPFLPFFWSFFERENNPVSDANSHIFLQTVIWTMHEYDSESHNQELQADIKIYLITIQKGSICSSLNNCFVPYFLKSALIIFISFYSDRILRPENNQTDQFNDICNRPHTMFIVFMLLQLHQLIPVLSS